MLCVDRESNPDHNFGRVHMFAGLRRSMFNKEIFLVTSKMSITGFQDLTLQFLFDDFEFADAVITLNRASLINRISVSGTLSIHRLVQFAGFTWLNLTEKLLYLDSAIRILFFGFPNTWKQRGYQQGHDWASWETCSVVVPHVSWLMSLTDKYNLKPTDLEFNAELIFRAESYLWETEQPTAARHFFEYGLQLNISKSSENYAQAYRLLGHIGLDVAQLHAALSAYKKALSLRLEIGDENSPALADVYDSIACSYAEIGDVDSAFENLSKAGDIHYAHNRPIWVECWKLQGLAMDQIMTSKFPKHSGDIVLLSRMKYMKGEKEEAQRLISRTIDSMFILARMLQADGESYLAAKLLREIVDMSRDVPEMKGHLAWALWCWAEAESNIGDEKEAATLRDMAKAERDKIEGRETVDGSTDNSFMSLVGWMLW
ncbi:hypothetical protein MGYG_02418 [Paecilomyces variotii No. 5]|uniref:DUF7779 domain-containing protein n=1 Tax=Byssochlamys spectabilis (strain No. 5 / NBRC 109023) TaxID=1356009 RepID=V5G2D3_BYSSN|nr:hypothetical protein MGYG_02418 [Paecilomyces variotii No. 5]